MDALLKIPVVEILRDVEGGGLGSQTKYHYCQFEYLLTVSLASATSDIFHSYLHIYYLGQQENKTLTLDGMD